MPIATVRGAVIHYQIVGEKGPWVSLSPGLRPAKPEPMCGHTLTSSTRRVAT